MSLPTIMHSVSKKVEHATEAVKRFGESVAEAEEKIYEEHAHIRGARNLHAAVRAPIFALQGQRIHAVNSLVEASRCRFTRGAFRALDRKLKISRQSEPSDDMGQRLLVHRTSVAAGRSISEEGSMRPGREGTLGAGIYFAETEAACAKKAQVYFSSKEYAIVTAKVDLGRCRAVEHGELEWRMVRDCGFEKTELEEFGFSSVGTNFHGGWEFCVFEADRVQVVDVTFHDDRKDGSADLDTNDQAEHGAIQELPMALIKKTNSDVWELYQPKPKTVAVIGPGAGLKKHAKLYEDLEALGFEVVPIYDDRYDYYPPGTEILAAVLGVKGVRMPDLVFNREKNLATFVDDVVLPRIRDLINEGRGPSAVIAASRGGIISMPYLWEHGWRGPSVVGNGGFVHTSAIPASVPCVLMTAGWDCFDTRSPERTARVLQKEDPAAPVLVYHNAADDHDLNYLTGDVLGRLVDLATSGAFDATAVGPWPAAAQLRLL